MPLRMRRIRCWWRPAQTTEATWWPTTAEGRWQRSNWWRHHPRHVRVVHRWRRLARGPTSRVAGRHLEVPGRPHRMARPCRRRNHAAWQRRRSHHRRRYSGARVAASGRRERHRGRPRPHELTVILVVIAHVCSVTHPTGVPRHLILHVAAPAGAPLARHAIAALAGHGLLVAPPMVFAASVAHGAAPVAAAPRSDHGSTCPSRKLLIVPTIAGHDAHQA
mmetsp:Transcript_40284/g.101170  ORF Transcript_40284/g.101170 Transcript_40284/m.101170 type:complete len:220 (+) Transcript_40284:903-1562(+)